jgi:hypothetical protein
LTLATRGWFTSLSENFINNWRTIKYNFLISFIGSKQQFKSEFHLEIIKQHKDKPLREYITRLDNEALEVKGVELNMVLYFFNYKGFYPGGFSKHLAGEKPTSMEDLKQRTDEWIMIEE